MDRSLLKTICYGLAVAMGVAVIVIDIVSPPSLATVATLLAVGLLAVGIAGLQKQ
jgi:hypothetical protein